MAEQRKTVSEIIEEMRRELREEKDIDLDLFAPTLTKETKAKLKGIRGKAKPTKGKKGKKKGKSKKAKKKPKRKAMPKKAKKKKGKR